MSTCPTILTIGGDIPADKVSSLCQAIRDEGVTLDWGGVPAWGDGPFQPATAQELLDATVHMSGELHLTEVCAPGGKLERLEAFCVANQIAFDRAADPQFEHGGAVRLFRPGAHDVECQIGMCYAAVAAIPDLTPLAITD